MNYTQLKVEAAEFSHRTDLDAKMDIFVELAESVINKDLRTLDMEKRLPIVVTDTYFDLPDDYREIRSLNLEIDGARDPLQQFPMQTLDRMYSRATGRPRAFAIHGGQIEFRPGIEASSPYNGTINYFASVPTLVSNPTTDILTKFPMIYLSAMIVQVFLFTEDDVNMQKWAMIYDSQIKSANKSSQGGRYVLPRVQVA